MNLHCTMVGEVCNGAASYVVSVSEGTANPNVVYIVSTLSQTSTT